MNEIHLAGKYLGFQKEKVDHLFTSIYLLFSSFLDVNQITHISRDAFTGLVSLTRL